MTTDWQPRRAALTQGSMALALRLAQAGLRVTLIEADAHDAQRRRDGLARAGALGVTVAVGPSAGADADLWIGPAPRAIPGALHVNLGQGPVGAGAAVIDISAPDLSLIEILAGSDPRATGLVHRLGAEALTVRAFNGPRLIAALNGEAESLVFDGSTPWEVDAAAETAGFTLGPCAAQDLRGLTPGALPVVARMVAEGRLGVTVGVGWYRYPGGGGRVIDPLIEDLAREEAHFARHPTRALPDVELQRRLIGALTKVGSRADPIPLRRVAKACGLPVGAFP